MSRCLRCGREASGSAAYCSHCGTRITGSAADVAAVLDLPKNYRQLILAMVAVLCLTAVAGMYRFDRWRYTLRIPPQTVQEIEGETRDAIAAQKAGIAAIEIRPPGVITVTPEPLRDESRLHSAPLPRPDPVNVDISIQIPSDAEHRARDDREKRQIAEDALRRSDERRKELEAENIRQKEDAERRRDEMESARRAEEERANADQRAREAEIARLQAEAARREREAEDRRLWQIEAARKRAEAERADRERFEPHEFTLSRFDRLSLEEGDLVLIDEKDGWGEGGAKFNWRGGKLDKLKMGRIVPIPGTNVTVQLLGHSKHSHAATIRIVRARTEPHSLGVYCDRVVGNRFNAG